MYLTFLGGADEVGASCLLFEIGGKRLLIDAGLRPSPKAGWGLAGDQLPDLSLIDHAGGLDAILVTHAHTDHTGALELVVGRYPDCQVYATPATIALTRVLHADSRRIMKTRLDEEGELPLFDEVATQKLLSAFVPVPFNTRLPLGEGLIATFYPAGHIAGAACIALESDEGRVLISGDVSISPQRTVDGMKPPPFRPDVLILESTYGARLHANRAVEERRLGHVCLAHGCRSVQHPLRRDKQAPVKTGQVQQFAQGMRRAGGAAIVAHRLRGQVQAHQRAKTGYLPMQPLFVQHLLQALAQGVAQAVGIGDALGREMLHGSQASGHCDGVGVESAAVMDGAGGCIEHPPHVLAPAERAHRPPAPMTAESKTGSKNVKQAAAQAKNPSRYPARDEPPPGCRLSEWPGARR